jgi:hypothetical protein
MLCEEVIELALSVLQVWLVVAVVAGLLKYLSMRF